MFEIVSIENPAEGEKKVYVSFGEERFSIVLSNGCNFAKNGDLLFSYFLAHIWEKQIPESVAEIKEKADKDGRKPLAHFIRAYNNYVMKGGGHVQRF